MMPANRAFSAPEVAENASRFLKRAAAWQISVSRILTDDTQRLDASNYDNRVERCLDALCQSGAKLRRLGDVTTNVFLPPGRPSRNYVEAGYGVPFLQGSHVVHFLPSDLKYIAQDTEQIGMFRIQAGWLLLTRSGTIGNVTICPHEWNGWAASEHIFRIVPNEAQCPSGYLYSCLASPIGQMQLSRQSSGAVVDELTADDVKDVRIPFPVDDDWQVIQAVHQAISTAMEARGMAVSLITQAMSDFAESWPIDE